MGSAPDMYFTIKASRYLGVAPWELERQSVYWKEWALTCLSAELDAGVYSRVPGF